MITVLGINTAIDRCIDLSVLRPGAVQRATGVRVTPGGKGLHVAQTIVALGERARLVGLDDAVHAELLTDHLRQRGVEWYPIRSLQPLRQCMALREDNGCVTEVLEPGPTVDAARRKALLDRVASMLDSSEALVLSGSLSEGFSTDTYAQLVREAKRHGSLCLVDASGEALRQAVHACPWSIKPNTDEASTLVGHPVVSIEGAVECVLSWRALGVARPVLTLSAKGAIACDDGGIYHAWTNGVAARNAVGSGDCFLAAMAVSAVRGDSVEASLRLAVACGAANAENEETGFVTLAQVQKWTTRVELERLGDPDKAAFASLGSR